VHYSPDPKDNPILSTGIEGQVQYIVSGDKRDMLKLEKVKGIPILSVREFVGLFIEFFLQNHWSGVISFENPCQFLPSETTI
jgi:predicted nucleic acid-binding protein